MKCCQIYVNHTFKYISLKDPLHQVYTVTCSESSIKSTIRGRKRNIAHLMFVCVFCNVAEEQKQRLQDITVLVRHQYDSCLQSLKPQLSWHIWQDAMTILDKIMWAILRKKGNVRFAKQIFL